MVNYIKNLYVKDFETPYYIKFLAIEAFCVDSPAFSYIAKSKGYTWFSSCNRCDVQGIC